MNTDAPKCDRRLTALHSASLQRLAAVACAIAILAVAACRRQPEAQAPVPRPVRVVTVERQDAGETVSLTGHIAAEDEAALAFRIGGRMIQRFVNVGDTVKSGQELARLDPQDELNGLRSAQTRLAAAEAQLTQARLAFERQSTLLAQGHTPRAQFDLAEKALRTAQAQADDAEIQVKLAADRVSFTVLLADAGGAVTARGAESGEVVQAGQMIVTIARQNGRDAVFDVPAQVLRSAPSGPEVTVRLADDPSVTATGRVREVAPQADPVTRTFEVKVGLSDPPPAMRLGATIIGEVRLASDKVISIPASALTKYNNAPAVWIVDPQKHTVSLRNIELLRFDPGTVVIAHGLESGDVVVTAGVQVLHPGQTVRLLGTAT